MIEEDTERELYWLWICNIYGAGVCTINKLLKHFDTPKEIFKASERDLEKVISIEKINKDLLSRITESRNYENIINIRRNLDKRSIRFISCEHVDFPEKLRIIDKSPFGIYIKGKILDFTKPTVAIVGARNCTGYGKDMAYDIGFQLAMNGVNVISGMARGIDSQAHLGAVNAKGLTGAVLGCGVDVCYPGENIELYERIIDSGMIISEFPCGSKPLSFMFPMRNRIISALSDKVIVVEAKERSGSLITAEYALEQGKDIYSVPGRTDDILSKGCNRLIKEGAGVIYSKETVMEDIGLIGIYNYKKIKNKNIILEKDLESLYSNLDFFPKSLQQIISLTGKKSGELLRDLIRLEMLGLVEEPSKNYYCRRSL